MKELHAKGVKREQIEAALNDLPFVSEFFFQIDFIRLIDGEV